VIGLARIGPALTSIIASFSVNVTPTIEIVMLELNIQVILPQSIALALFGGGFSESGIYSS